MKKVTYFDVEWANNKNRSICQMGIMCEDYDTDEPICPEIDIYVNPEEDFDLSCTKIHGINYDKIKNEPTFPQIWNKYEYCFTNSIIIGHNVASADLNALVKNLIRYNIDIPSMYYIDTLEIAKKYISNIEIENFKLSTLCKFFDVSIEQEHDAFSDACCCKDLFLAMKKQFDFSLNDFVHEFVYDKTYYNIECISNPLLRKTITEFYGIIQGFALDKKIEPKEIEYINQWKIKNKKYIESKLYKNIFEFIDKILDDNIITTEEFQSLHSIMVEYFKTISSSPITTETQILEGILKGILADNIISELEITELNKWLIKNSYLKGHFPFDKLIDKINDILQDNIISSNEQKDLLKTINDILEPVKDQEQLISNIKNLHICLTGNFNFGQKAKVEDYLRNKGAIIDNGITKTLNILIVGDKGSELYSNNNYGSKIKKAIECNQKGLSINIIKEKDFFKLQKDS